jgi:hypothetical protein
MHIRPYRSEDEAAVIQLWKNSNLTRSWNNPHQDIARKLQVQPEWFLVGIVGDQVMATVIVGYDGHRGWILFGGRSRASAQRIRTLADV